MAVVLKIDVVGLAAGWFDPVAAAPGWFDDDLGDTADESNTEFLAGGISDGNNDLVVQADFESGHTAYVDDASDSFAVGNPDVVAVIDIIYNDPSDLPDDVFTDWSDWSWAQAPPIDDNNPEVEPQALDDQDFTDTADYGSQTDVAIDDNDQDFQQSSVTPDEADTTDFADYGSQTDQPIDDNNPEPAPSALDDQDFTDTADYGLQTDPLSDDNNPDLAPSALDDQDFTDTEDYGSQSDPLNEDAPAAPENFLLGISEPEYDWTDFEDYGSQSDPLSDDSNSELAPSALDDQDFTDTADYGMSVPPPIASLGEGPCEVPNIIGTGKYGSSVSASSHAIPIPPAMPLASRLFLIFSTNGAVSAPPTGWTLTHLSASGDSFSAWRDTDGTESATVTVNLSANGSGYAILFGILTDTFEMGVAPVAVATPSTGTSVSPDPPSLTAPWGSSDLACFIGAALTNTSVASISAYPTNLLDNRTTSDATDNGIAVATVGASSSTLNPDAFTYPTSETWSAWTFAIKGNCTRVSLFGTVCLDDQDFTDTEDYGSQSDPLNEDAVAAPENVLLGDGLGLDNQDFTDFADYGFSADPLSDDNFDVVCSAPTLTGRVDGFGTAASYVLTLPSYSATDLLIGYIVTTDTDTGSPSLPAGWTNLTTLNTPPTRARIFYRFITGGIGTTVTVNTFDTLSHKAAWMVECYSGVRSGQAPAATGWASIAGTTEFGASGVKTASWGSDHNLWVAADQGVSDLAVVSTHQLANSLFEQVTDGTATGGQWVSSSFAAYASSITVPLGAWTTINSSGGNVLILRGQCVDQAMVPIHSGQGLDVQDFTDLFDYGTQTDPHPDNLFIEDFLLGIGTDQDDQDFTDFTDYGSQTDPHPSDNNPELAPSALDDQDFTDFEDYGSQTDPHPSDNNPEVSVAAVALDDQDFTDFDDYGFRSDPLVEDVVAPEDFLLGVGIGLDDQDFTDLADYGSQTDPYPDDNNPDLAPSALDDQDFTDFTDYGFSVDPLSDNNPIEDFLLGIGTDQDDQDFTDFTDYGSQTDPYRDDNNPDLGPSALDDQDFTDFEDYGSQTDQPIDDNNPEVAPSALALDDQDFTDLGDYGSQSDPLSDNVTIEDFILGYGSGLDEQDWTDHTDYSYVLEPNSNYADVSVLVTGGNIVVGIGCFEVVSWIDIPDVSSIWTGVPEPTMTWNPIAEASNSWSDVTEPTNPWVDISDPANTWTEDC